MKLTYREDIDGLRAISVLAVVLNHAGVGLVSGGYIGVDVFFVISGYLITSIIAREIQSNEFTLARFYERRIRRILPALFPVLAFTVAVCAAIYEPEKFREFGRSVMATALFVSNINFWKESGYFEAPSQLKPLLHTWSLAVEEQYYIFFPLLMVILSRYVRRQTPYVLLGIAALSFSLSMYGLSSDPAAAFYLVHMRFWELLIGSLLALNLIPAEIGRKYGATIGLVGLLLIAIPIFIYTENTSFPGASALPPVLGAAMVIFSGMEGKFPAGRFLSLPPLVFIGRISYSLYLWHWPLIIFAKYYAIRQLTNVESGLVLAGMLAISTLSWRFVESPFRTKGFLSQRQVFAFAVSGITMMFSAGALILYFRGYPNRPGLEYLAKEAKQQEVWLFKECNINSADNPASIPPCEIGDKSQISSFMLWGDSHAPTYGKAVYRSAEELGFSGILTYSQGCPPLLGMVAHPRVGDVPCNEYNDMVLSYLSEHPEIHTVFIASRWTIWLEGKRYKEERGQQIFLTDALNEARGNASEEELFILGLERTVNALLDAKRNIVIISPLPEIGYDVPSASFIAGRTGRDINEIIAPSLDEFLARNQKTFSILKSFEAKYGIQMIEPWRAFCTADMCRAAIDGIPLYRDDDHLSVFGSELVSGVFNTFFASMKQAGK